jgi:hypothetical protein
MGKCFSSRNGVSVLSHMIVEAMGDQLKPRLEMT